VPWLPPSPESRSLFRFAAVAVFLGFALVTVAFLLFGDGSRASATRALNEEASLLAVILNHSPELPRTRAILELVKRETADRPITIEAFIVAPPGETVYEAARESERKRPWEEVQQRVATDWPRYLLATVPLHRDPAAPEKITGDLYVAGRWTGANPSLALAAGAIAAALTALLFAPLVVTLTRNVYNPLHKIVEANRASLGGRNLYLMVPPAVAPPGELREVLFHRNHVLETLKTREETLARRTHDMEVFFEFTRQLALVRDPADVPRLSLSAMANSVEFDVACMVINRDDVHYLMVRAAAPLSEYAQAEAERLAVAAYCDRSSVQMAGEKLDTVQQILDPRGTLLEGPFPSAYWAEIGYERRVVGVVGFLAQTEKKFNTEALRFLNFVAAAVSLAVKRSQGSRTAGAPRQPGAS